MSVVEDWTEECSGFNAKSPLTTETVAKSMSSENGLKRRGNVLYVRDFSRESEPIDRNIIGFSNHRKLGSFRIEDNDKYNDNECEQNVIKDSLDLDLISKMNINLMDGFEKSSLIKDYKTYKYLKWKYFLKWIQNSGSLESRSPESVPHFISFGGLFTSLMSTPNKMESWTLLVSKFKDSIFMNKIRLNEGSNGRRDRPEVGKGSDDNRSKQFVDKTPFLTARVAQIITQQNRESVEGVVNEYEKYFSCYETQIGDHRLLLMSEIDAIDEEENQYEIKCAKHQNFGQKLFNWWSHCVVADIDYILIGLKDNNEVLKSVDKLKVEEMPEMSAFRWNTEKSFDFVNRVLIYIKELLESAADLDVFKVSFKQRENCVRSLKLPANHFIPNWFTGQASEEPIDNPMEEINNF